MAAVKKVVLDILKPHNPSVLEFCQSIAGVGQDYSVSLTVLEVDENTETLKVVVEGPAIDFEAIQSAIVTLGGSLHSVDEVVAVSEPITKKGR